MAITSSARSFAQEFKEFVSRGNVIDLAVGVIIGAAFGKIISSLVTDVIMPPIGMLLGNVDFSSLAYELRAAEGDKPAITIGYGMFLNQVIDFLIVAFVIFLLVRQINRLKRQEPTETTPTTKNCDQCMMAIPIAAKRCPHCTSQLA